MFCLTFPVIADTAFYLVASCIRIVSLLHLRNAMLSQALDIAFALRAHETKCLAVGMWGNACPTSNEWKGGRKEVTTFNTNLYRGMPRITQISRWRDCSAVAVLK